MDRSEGLSRPEPRWKVAVYIRLSREDGNDESVSVANQRKIIGEFVLRELGTQAAVVDEYTDDGATGTDYERPQFQRMLRDIQAGTVNCVVCKTLSRAFRNYSDQGYFLERFFPLHGTRFIALGGPKIDSFLDPEGVSGYEVPISGIMNDRYAGRTSLDVRRTFDMKRRRGEFIGAFAPYGYRKDPEDKNHLLVDNEAAQVVREIFCRYRDGASKQGIAKHLNALGVPSPGTYKRRQGLRYQSPQMARSDGLWSAKTIGGILSSQVYLGHMVQGRQRTVSYKVHNRITPPKEEWFVVPNTHEAIVDQALFDTVQGLCGRCTRTPPGRREVYPLSGMVFCADCGKATARSCARGHAYYRCRTYKEKSGQACSSHSIRVDRVEGAVLAVLRSQEGLLEAREELTEKLRRARASGTGRMEPEALLERRREELARIRSLTDGAYLDWKSGVLTQEEYRRLKAKLTEQAGRVEDAVKNLEGGSGRERAGERPGPDAFLEYFHHLPCLERSLVVVLVDRVLIYEGGRIEVRLKFADPCCHGLERRACGPV